jgi:branched-chain amino acid transport system ATP-binding protein
VSWLLQVDALKAAYGAAQVLFDVSFAVGDGEVVTLLGRNGMGKTPTISTIMGLVPATTGTITFGGVRLDGLPPFRVAQAGLGLVPEGRQIFPTLSVEENLMATAAARFGLPRWRVKDIYAMFPSFAAPLIRNEIWSCLKHLKAEGQGILLVDKHIDALLQLADRHVVVEKGRVVWSGTSSALADLPAVRQRYLQV